MSSACEVHVCILLHSKESENVDGKVHTVNYYVMLLTFECRKNAFGNVVGWKKAINLKQRRHDFA